MQNCVFIQTNHKQIIGAIVAQHSLRRYSTHNDQFDVKIIEKKDYPYFDAREGQTYLRDGVKRVWRTTTSSPSRRRASCRPN